jgi:hypothetical protein
MVSFVDGAEVHEVHHGFRQIYGEVIVEKVVE